MTAPMTTTGPATTTITRTEEDEQTEDGPVSHIVRTKRGEDAAAKRYELKIKLILNHLADKTVGAHSCHDSMGRYRLRHTYPV